METGSHPANADFFSSWSGGKDSCLALYRAVRAGGRARRLLTMMADDGAKSRFHGIPAALFEAQSRSLGIPAEFIAEPWEKYEEAFTAAMKRFRQDGITAGVFGDIDIEEHRAWVRKVCAAAGVTPIHPLWKEGRRGLLEEFIGLGFKAVIIAVQDDKLDRKFLGKAIDLETLAGFEKAGVDPSGEMGEYHTLVTDGPIFSAPVGYRAKGISGREGYSFLEIEAGPGAGRTPAATA